MGTLYKDPQNTVARFLCVPERAVVFEQVEQLLQQVDGVRRTHFALIMIVRSLLVLNHLVFPGF
jgi:hypothetical protein